MVIMAFDWLETLLRSSRQGKIAQKANRRIVFLANEKLCMRELLIRQVIPNAKYLPSFCGLFF